MAPFHTYLLSLYLDKAHLLACLYLINVNITWYCPLREAFFRLRGISWLPHVCAPWVLFSYFHVWLKEPQKKMFDWLCGTISLKKTIIIKPSWFEFLSLYHLMNSARSYSKIFVFVSMPISVSLSRLSLSSRSYIKGMSWVNSVDPLDGQSIDSESSHLAKANHQI